jgi:hypothetical protein
MRRREFMTLLGGAAVSWPVAARAQPATRLPRIGWLVTGSPAAYRFSLAAFRGGLQQTVLGGVGQTRCRDSLRPWRQHRVLVAASLRRGPPIALPGSSSPQK